MWSAALYQEADTIREATDAALELYEIVTGGKDFDRSLWTAASHKSLCAGFNEADPDAIIAWNKRMADLVTMDGMPGLQQQLQVAHIELSPQTKKELDERFVLIYTGQRRLARNLLRDVVGRYVGNEPDSLFALEEIQKTAALMRFELERGNVDGFAKLLDYHWELSKKIDAGSSNTLIEQIFGSIEELVDGKLVCGAGGGGFLQVILKKGVTRQMVEERLKEVFMDSLVGVADCKLVWE